MQDIIIILSSFVGNLAPPKCKPSGNTTVLSPLNPKRTGLF